MAWNGSDNGKATSAKSPSGRGTRPACPPSRGLAKGLAALLIIAVVGGLAIWWFIGRAGAPSPAAKVKTTKPSTITEVKPAPAAQPKPVEEKPAAPVVENNDPHRVIEILNVETNKSFGKIYTRVRRADGKIAKIVTPANPPIFTHGTDQLLQLSLCQNAAVGIPPLPMRPGGGAQHDKEFLASLKDEIVINPDDSDRVRQQKETVIQARQEIKELMDQGYHFDDILSDYMRLTSENRDIRNKAMRELNEIHASGDVEAEREYQIKIDAALQQMGIDPLDKPMTPEERRAAHEERRAQIELERQAKAAAEAGNN